MALSTRDYLTTLLSKNFVEEKTRGAPTSDVEGAAVINSVLITLLLCPRSVLYLAYIARNGLIKSIQDELAAIDVLRQDIEDLANVSVAITDVASLNLANDALLDMDQQGNVDPVNASFRRFDSAISTFLNGPISKNVKKAGTAGLSRPDTEALQALPTDFSSLVALHKDMLSRYYALAVGVQNFLATQAAGLLASSTAFRVRQDIQSVIADLQTDDSGAQSRDHVTTLLSARAALKSLSTRPSVSDPVIDTVNGFPPGATVRGKTADCYATLRSSAGPWAGGTIVMGGVSHLLPMDTLTVGTRALLAGKAVSWPVTVPAYYDLYLRFDSTNVRVPLNATSSPTSMSFTTALNTLRSALTAYADVVEYVCVGTQRIAIVAKAGVSQLAVTASYVTSHPTVGLVSYTNSAHALLGLPLATVLSGACSSSIMAEALQMYFGGQVSVVLGQDGVITLTSLIPNQLLSITDTTGLGFASTSPNSDHVVFYGQLLGAPTTFAARELVDVGDTIQQNGFTRTITAFDDTQAVLDFPIVQFDSAITVQSALYSTWSSIDGSLHAQLPSWLSTKFAKDLSSVDAAVAPLYGSAAPANRAGALDALQELSTALSAVLASVSTIDLPADAATVEKDVISGLLQTLTERKYDRAVDLLSRCQVREVFTLDWQTASYAGAFMKSMSDLAQNDVVFPNLVLDDNSKISVVQE